MSVHDLVFICPQCHRWLEAPGDLAGVLIECPLCEAIIEVPAQSMDPSAVTTSGRTTPHAPPGDLRGSTVRIELPPNLGLPPAPPKRKFILRRSS